MVKNESKNSQVKTSQPTTGNGKKRFVSEIVNDSNNKLLDDYMFYKFDDYHFLKESDYNVIYKLPLQEKNLENLENKNEPIYKVIMLLTAEKFNKVVDYLLADSQNYINQNQN